MNLLGLTTSTTPVVTTQPEIDGRCPRCGRPVPIHKRGGRRRVWYSDARRAVRLGIASWDRQRLQVENSPGSRIRAGRLRLRDLATFLSRLSRGPTRTARAGPWTKLDAELELLKRLSMLRDKEVHRRA